VTHLGPVFFGVETNLARLPAPPDQDESDSPLLTAWRRAYRAWGDVYVRRDDAGGPPTLGEEFYPWADFRRTLLLVRGLATASPAEVLAFYRRCGPLGYPDQHVLGGEPLAWVQWQARRLDCFCRLEDTFRHDRPDAVRALLAEGESRSPIEITVTPQGSRHVTGERTENVVLHLPDARGDGLGDSIFVTLSRSAKDKQVMRAARVAIQQMLTITLGGVRLVPAEKQSPVRREGRYLDIRQVLEWEIPTLLQAIYLRFFLGHVEGSGVRFCEICGTPYLRGHAEPPTCSPACSVARRQRKRRESLREKR
jgi:hypothetical protein